MSSADKSIKCSDCGSDFNFSIDEQAFFAEKGFTNDLTRCRSCRASRMVQSNASSAYSGYSQPWQPRRQMFAAICAGCGQAADLLFAPHDGRPVYCRDCYAKARPSTGR